MRIAMGIEYDGGGYSGWQRQSHILAVQEVVERAIGRVAAHPVEVTCGGRTDAGVHAVGQVIHFDTPAERNDRSWTLGCNAHLPDDVSIHWARHVSDDFHARFSALSRTYRYVILNRATRSALWHGRAWWVHRPLTVERMQEGARCLVGEHDFSSYRAVACQAHSPVRIVRRLDVWRTHDLIFIEIQANGFLHHMVRNIAGVLAAIGRGDRSPDWAGEVLNWRDRTLGGVTAPAAGLYFREVEYPPAFGIPEGTRLPF
ncbi:MAG: tRNA pseudouridine(38-40) synthase TruA [Gammaproteobacteria bacterium]|jgi:tRNA pseudouridine38-40 synthase